MSVKTALILARPLGRRSCVNVNPERRSRANASRSRRRELLHASPQLQDLSLEFRRRQVRHVEAHHNVRRLVEHPRAVERRTPRSVAMVTSPVRSTRPRNRWS